VATGAIAHGALVADKMQMPFIYVRSEAKQMGLEIRLKDILQKARKRLLLKI
jgi:orotate phosphoribosyltransferase